MIADTYRAEEARTSQRKRGRSVRPESQIQVRPCPQATHICKEHLAGQYTIEIIDLLQNPRLAKGEQIIATPTLVKCLPAPLRRFNGDLSRANKILPGLDLRSARE